MALLHRRRVRRRGTLQSKVQAFGEIAECLRRLTQHGVFFTKACDLGAALTLACADDPVVSFAVEGVSPWARVRRKPFVTGHEGPPQVDPFVSPHGGPGTAVWPVCNDAEQRSPAT